MKLLQINMFALFMVAFLLLPSCSEAQNDQTNEAAGAASSLLWKIDDKTMEQPSYLYGTIHIIPKSDFEMGEALSKALRTSDVLVMELDLDMMGMMGAMQKMMLPGNATLEQYLTDSQYDSLQAFLKDTLEIPAMQLALVQKMKPFFVAQTFYTNMLGEEPMSFEITFKSIADSQNMEVIGLETIDEQVAMLDSIPIEDQVEMLMEGVRSYDEMKSEFREMVRIYRTQNLDSLYHYMNESSEELMEFESLLLANRNIKWAEKLDSLLGDSQYFVAVGAAHLPGENGMINLLRQSGYEVTPVSTK